MIRVQPYYQHNGITIFHGDCLEVMAGLPAQSFDAVICDPPYGTTACAWDSPIPFEPMWTALKRLIRPRAPVVLFGNEPFSSLLRVSNLDWYKYDWVWRKSRPTGFLDANRKPLNDHELVSVFYDLQPVYNPQKWKGSTNHVAEGRANNSRKASQYSDYDHLLQFKTDDKYPRKVLEFASLDPAQMRHPNEKPLALMEYLILTYTNADDTVLDFTVGSGTTLRAAKNLGRCAIGIEIDERYCEIAAQRLSQEVMELAV